MVVSTAGKELDVTYQVIISSTSFSLYFLFLFYLLLTLSISFKGCDRQATCAGHGTCTAQGTCNCDLAYNSSNCNSCADRYFNYPKCYCMFLFFLFYPFLILFCLLQRFLCFHLHRSRCLDSEEYSMSLYGGVLRTYQQFITIQ